MQGIVITHIGMEDIAAREVGELITAEPAAKKSVVVFSCKSLIELCRLCYLAQAAIRVLCLLGSCNIGSEYRDRKSVV
jgi:23S rRNA G2445 N2-methylase RlmL